MSTPRVLRRAVGAPIDRLDGAEKVKGGATYAYEWPVMHPAYLHPLQAEIAAGRVQAVDVSAAAGLPGVLAVLTHENAGQPAGPDPEQAVLSSPEVAFRGQIVGAVLADSPEAAREAARLVRLEYESHPPDLELRADRDDLRKPAHAAIFGMAEGDLMDGSVADTVQGDVEAALAQAAVSIDETYTTPMYHHNPMEPHTAVAIWSGDDLTIYLSTQGVSLSQQVIAAALGLDPARVRVVSPHVGGAFGSKVYPHGYAVLAAIAARHVPDRPVKFALTRQQMFALVGYRPPAIQRVRLGVDPGGYLTAIAHDVVQQTARLKPYAEQIATCTRGMYAAENRRTTHRIAALDVPVPTIMRAPGESTGMFALESAMDEMAIACGLDPVEFRVRNEPATDPETERPFSSRELVACLREGARRFGWAGRDPAPRARRAGEWLIGTGVAASTYPSPRMSGNSARISIEPDGRYAVQIAAADIGTGSRTVLTQIAADALNVRVADVDLRVGDTVLPRASTAGASSGTTSWGACIMEAARVFRERHGVIHNGRTSVGLEATAQMPENPSAERYSMHTFGAQFVEVRVSEVTGEVRVSRLLGVFDAGRIINPKTARSQLLGAMTQGVSMALHEHSVLDPHTGHVVNHDLAEYHIATAADAPAIDVYCVGEPDPHINPMGSKGLGEVGIVGTAAAIANAAYHATGVRVRDLPITLDKFLR